MSGLGSTPGHPEAHWNPLHRPSVLDLDNKSGASASRQPQTHNNNQTSDIRGSEIVNDGSSSSSVKPLDSEVISDTVASDFDSQSSNEQAEVVEKSVVSDLVKLSIDSESSETIISDETVAAEPFHAQSSTLDAGLDGEDDVQHPDEFIESGNILNGSNETPASENHTPLNTSKVTLSKVEQESNGDVKNIPSNGSEKSMVDDPTSKGLKDQKTTNDSNNDIQHTSQEYQQSDFSLDQEPAELSFSAESNPFFEQTIVEEVQENSDNEVETMQYSLKETETSSPLISAKNSPSANLTKSPITESAQFKKSHDRVISVFGAPGDEDPFFAAINQASTIQSSPQKTANASLEPSMVEDDKRLSVFAATSTTDANDSFFESLASEPKSDKQSETSSGPENLFTETPDDTFFDQIGSSNTVSVSDSVDDSLPTDNGNETTVNLKEDQLSQIPATLSSTTTEEKIEPQSDSMSQPSLSTFSFLENDDDLLPDELEEEASTAPAVAAESEKVASTNVHQNKYAPASVYSSTSVSSGYAYSHTTGHVPAPPLQKATSFIDRKPATNAFDLPTNIVPKSSVRPSASLHTLHSTGSSYFTLPQMAPPSQNASVSAASAPGVVSSTAPPKALQKSKSFFEDLPLPAKRPISRQQSMTVVGPSGSRRSSSSQNQPAFPQTDPSAYGQQAQPLPHAPQLQSSQSFNGQSVASISAQTPYGYPAQPAYGQPPVQNAYVQHPVQSSYVQPLTQSPYTHAGAGGLYSHTTEQAAVNSAASVNKLRSPPNPYAQVAATPAAASTILSPPNPYAQPNVTGVSQNSAMHEPSSLVSRVNPYNPAVVPGTSRSSTPGSVNPYAPQVGGSAYIPNAAHARTLSNSSNHSMSPKSSQQSPYAPSYTYASPPPGGHPSTQKVKSSYAPVPGAAQNDKYTAGNYDPNNRISTQALKAPSTAPSRNQSLGDLPLDITRRSIHDPSTHKYRVPQAYANGSGFGHSSGVPASVQEFSAPVDNEALLRRQFPIFNWNSSGKVSYVIPSMVSYGSVNASLSVKVSPVQNVLEDAEYVTLGKFPGPLVNSKGVIKGKKKELEKWIDEKVSLLEAKNDPVLNDRIVLWKFLKLLVSSEEHISKMGEKTLESIALLLNPRSGFKNSNPESFSSGLDLYKQQQAQFNGHSRNSSSGNSGLAGGTPNSMSGGGNKASKEDVRSLYSSIEVGDRDGALKYCLDKNYWAHALVISSSLGPEVWNQTVADFVRNSVEPIDGVQSRGLSFMYRVFSGAGEFSLAALKPAKPLSANLQNDYHERQLTLQNLSDWRTYLAFILLNESPKANEAILGLGKLLLEYGLVDAGHMCIILSGVPSFGSPEASGITLVGADSRVLPVGIGRDPDTLLMSEIYEYILLNNSPSVVGPSPHLLIYKLQHAILLADYGFLAVSQKNYDSVSSLVKSNSKLKFNPAFLSRVEEVGKWLSAESSGSSWLSSKKLDRALLQSFNKFVAGDDASSSESASVGADGAIFKRLASTPGPHQQPTPWSADGSPYTSTPSQAHGPSDHTLSRAQSTGVLKKPMGSYDAYPPPVQTSELNRTYSHSSLDQAGLQGNTPQYGAYAPMSQHHEIDPSGGSYGVDYSPAAVANSRRYSTSSSGHGNSRPHTPLMGHEQPLSGYQPYNPAASAPVSRPSSSQRARMSPYSPERLGRPATSSTVSTAQNPYAPASLPAHAKSSGPVANPYAPISSSAASDSQEDEMRESTMSDISATPFSYGYNPYGGAYDPDAPASGSATSASYEPSNDKDKNWDGTQPVNHDPSATDEYGESSYSYGGAPSDLSSRYDPEGGDMLPPMADDPIDDAENGSASGSGYYTPNGPPGFASGGPALSTVPSYSSYQTASTVIPEENEDEIEDLGISNKNSEQKTEGDSKDNSKTDSAGKEDHKESKGWFGWLRKGQEHDDKPKAVRAKLGEQSSFYYDKELKRWVNKNAPAEDNKPAAPPPPPKSMGAHTSIPRPGSSTPSLPSGPPSASSTPIPGPPSKASTPSLPPGPSPVPRPPVKTGGGLDDLLASAPTGGSKRPKKNARSRYVDVMAQK